MVLASTLVIDTCESYQRTEANHSASWFGRFALSLGPLMGLVVIQMWGFEMVVLVAMVLALLSLVLIEMVDFPFRAPEEHVHMFSCDRFLLNQGGLLFANLLMISLALGIIIGQMTTLPQFGMMMVGFLFALLAQRFVFRDAELKSEVVTGLILMLAAQLQTDSAFCRVYLINIYRNGNRYHRFKIPVVLYQTKSPLSAWNFSEFVYAGMGDRYCRRCSHDLRFESDSAF